MMYPKANKTMPAIKKIIIIDPNPIPGPIYKNSIILYLIIRAQFGKWQ